MPRSALPLILASMAPGASPIGGGVQSHRRLGFRRGFLAEQGIYLIMRDVHPLGGCHALLGLTCARLLDQQVQLASSSARWAALSS